MKLHFKEGVKAFLGRPVCNAAYAQKQQRDEQSLTGWCDFLQTDIQSSEALLRDPPPLDESAKKRSIVWLVCNFTHPFGGIFTILRIADALSKRGYESTFAVYDNPGFDVSLFIGQIREYFPSITPSMFKTLGVDPDGLGDFDIGIATFWTSAYKLLKMKRLKRKLYLIQDYECGFYPAGTTYALVENTYNMPFNRMINTTGLRGWIESQYPCKGKSFAFTPSVDERYFAPIKPIGKPTRVLFYMRPDTPRNAFSLCAAFADALKARYLGDVELVGAGCGTETLKSYVSSVTPAGIVPYDGLPRFYAGFDIAVCFMMTKHPSYLPFELMASGALIIANENPANSWFYQSGENCLLAPASLNALMQAFQTASDPQTHKRIANAAQNALKAHSWQNAQASIADFFDTMCK